MTIKLVCEAFSIEGGKAAILREGWSQQPDRLSNLVLAECLNSHIGTAQICEPGIYLVWLNGTHVIHRHTGTENIISLIEPLRLQISPADLESGEVLLPVQFQTLLRIRLVRDGRPAPGEKIVVASESATAEITADSQGRIVVPEDPRDLVIVPPEDVEAILEEIVG